MVEVTVDVSGEPSVSEELFAWIQRIPLVAELDPRHTGEELVATLASPAQLGTLAMAVATFLRTKPGAQRPTVTVTAPNGESLDLTASPDPHAIRRVYIAMDKPEPPPVTPVLPATATTTPAIESIVDAEIIEDDPGSTPSTAG